jgi:cation-transporting P-type ATPase 13A2
LLVVEDCVGEERESTNLVPGDIVKLSHSQLSLIPADMFLLSGDAIVNESMLTGESVPVNKIAVKDHLLSKWKDGSDDVDGDTAKCFLHYGTRIVRVRGGFVTDGSPEIPATALVVRTGNCLSSFIHSLA